MAKSQERNQAIKTAMAAEAKAIEDEWRLLEDMWSNHSQGQFTQCESIESTFRRLSKITNYAHGSLENVYKCHVKTSQDMNQVIDTMHDIRYQLNALMKENKPIFQRDQVEKIRIDGKTYFEVKPL